MNLLRYFHYKNKRTIAFEIIFLCCAFVLPEQALSQDFYFKGFVFTADGKPVNRLKLFLKGGQQYRTESDSTGYFHFQHIVPGNYTIRLSIEDVVVKDTNVTLEGNTQMTFTFNQFTFRQLRELLIVEEAAVYTPLRLSANARLNQRLLEIPQNIAIVTRQNIKETGALSLDETIALASGSLPYNAGGLDMGLMMRGSPSNYNMMRNGIGIGYYFNQALDVNMIERVEYIKGPASFLISNADPIGMVNIVTKQPTDKPLANVEMGYGSWNMMRMSFDIGGPLTRSGALTYRMNAAIQDQQQPYQYGYLKRQFAAIALKYAFDENTSVTAEYNYSRGRALESVHYVPTIDGRFFVLPDNFTVSDPNMQGVLSYDHYLRFNFIHRLDNNWSVNAQTGLVSGAWQSNVMSINAGLPVRNDTIYRSISRDNAFNKLYTASVFLQGRFNTGNSFEHSLIAGIDYGRSQVDQRFDIEGDMLGLYYPQPEYYIPQDSLLAIGQRHTQISYLPRNYYTAFYLQDQVKMYNKFMLTLGARYTYAYASSNIAPTYFAPSRQANRKIIPRVGFTYLLNKDISLYALYDAAFKPQLGVSYSGKPYDPVTGSNTEVGFKSYWCNKKLVANVAFYYTKRSNVLIDDIQNPGFKIETGEQTAKGIEFDMNGQLTNHINIIANYAYTDTRISKSGDGRIPVGLYNIGAPVNNSFFAFARYKFMLSQLKELWLGAGVRYMDRSNTSTVENEYVKGYSLLQAAAGYTWKQFYVTLNVYNLTDTEYAINARKISEREWIYTPGQPVNFRLSLGYNL